MSIAVHLRCGVGELERLAFTLEGIAPWKEPCIVRVFCEIDAREVLEQFLSPPHSFTVIRVPRRLSWLSDHARMSGLLKEEEVFLLQPGVRIEWETALCMREELHAGEHTAVVSPSLRAMFEEQAGEEQWHERIASEQSVFSGVQFSRGKLRANTGTVLAGERTEAFALYASVWKTSALRDVLHRDWASAYPELGLVQMLHRKGKSACMADAVGFVLAGTYTPRVSVATYGWYMSAKWRMGFVL